MAQVDVTIDMKAAAENFTAAVVEFQRLLIGFGRAARRSTWSMRRLGEQLPDPRQARIERRANRRRQLRMLREQQRAVNTRRRINRGVKRAIGWGNRG